MRSVLNGRVSKPICQVIVAVFRTEGFSGSQYGGPAQLPAATREYSAGERKRRNRLTGRGDGVLPTRTRSIACPGANCATESAVTTPAARLTSAAHRTARTLADADVALEALRAHSEL